MASMHDLVRTMNKPSSKQTERAASQQNRMPSQARSLTLPRQVDQAQVNQPNSAPVMANRAPVNVSPLLIDRGPSPPKSLKLSRQKSQEPDVVSQYIQSPQPNSRLTNQSRKAPSVTSGLVQPVRILTPKSIAVPVKAKTPSQRNSQTGGSRQAQKEVEEEELDNLDDEQSEYSEYYYPEYYPQSQHSYRIEPRAETSDGHEACRCFPKRSSKHVSSMLYENITCVHSGLKGQTHQGVFKFEDNWNSDYEVPRERKNKMRPPDTRFVLGYPRPVFDPVSDDDEDDEYYDEDDDVEINNNQDNKSVKTAVSRKNDQSKNTNNKKDRGALNVQQKKQDASNKTKQTNKDDKNAKESKGKKPEPVIYLDDSDDEYEELSREDKYYPIRLPQIGYSPPPSRENSRLSARSQTILPPLPESPHLTNQRPPRTKLQFNERRSERPGTVDDLDDSISVYSGRLSANERQNEKLNRQIDRSRRFHGVYYDPATKQRMEFNIQPKFRTSFRGWDAQLGDRNSGGNRETRMPSRMSVPNSRNTNRDIPEEE